MKQMVGDAEISTASSNRAAGTSSISANYRVIRQPQAAYTNAARIEGYSGAVRLKMTLLSNGTVGKVEVVKSAPYGLTDTAIEAAKKTVLGPKINNGQPVSIIITRENTAT
ncbi:MAG: energy transducer TonB, partial [Pyrinomonadaceae bacterium]|nr:energy transducer TonB [Pyrinomonadaceae bacterium]